MSKREKRDSYDPTKDLIKLIRFGNIKDEEAFLSNKYQGARINEILLDEEGSLVRRLKCHFDKIGSSKKFEAAKEVLRNLNNTDENRSNNDVTSQSRTNRPPSPSTNSLPPESSPEATAQQVGKKPKIAAPSDDTSKLVEYIGTRTNHEKQYYGISLFQPRHKSRKRKLEAAHQLFNIRDDYSKNKGKSDARIQLDLLSRNKSVQEGRLGKIFEEVRAEILGISPEQTPSPTPKYW